MLTGEMRVYIAVGVTDMRKAIDGLSIMVAEQLELDPLSGHLFAFSNRSRSMVKVLYWDRNGFCLWQKRLERDHFRWPESRQEVLEVGRRELSWLLDGLDLRQQHAHGKLEYKHVF